MTKKKAETKPAKQVKSKKKAEKPRKNQEKNGVLVEKTDSQLDLCGAALNARQYNFIVNYLTPGQPCFRNALQSAIKAGYKKATASADIYTFLQTKEIQKIIKANEHLLHTAISETAKQAIELKRQRAFFNITDFYKDNFEPKHLSKIPEDKRLCIDAVDVKTRTYILPNREKELNDIIKIDSELSKGQESADVEETREIMMERITIRETTRMKQANIDIENSIIEPGEE